jgi:hypothetical protein
MSVREFPAGAGGAPSHHKRHQGRPYGHQTKGHPGHGEIGTHRVFLPVSSGGRMATAGPQRCELGNSLAAILCRSHSPSLRTLLCGPFRHPGRRACARTDHSSVGRIGIRGWHRPECAVAIEETFEPPTPNRDRHGRGRWALRAAQSCCLRCKARKGRSSARVAAGASTMAITSCRRSCDVADCGIRWGGDVSGRPFAPQGQSGSHRAMRTAAVAPCGRRRLRLFFTRAQQWRSAIAPLAGARADTSRRNSQPTGDMAGEHCGPDHHDARGGEHGWQGE